MQAFERLFDGVNFRKGTEVAFATHHKGQLVTQIDGKQVGDTWACMHAAAVEQWNGMHRMAEALQALRRCWQASTADNCLLLRHAKQPAAAVGASVGIVGSQSCHGFFCCFLHSPARLAPFTLPPWSRHCSTYTWARILSAAMRRGLLALA